MASHSAYTRWDQVATATPTRCGFWRMNLPRPGGPGIQRHPLLHRRRSVLRWLANIERFRALLEGVTTLYPGHGRAGGVKLLDAQKDYLLAYCAALMEVAGDSAATDERAKEELAGKMRRILPGAPLEFMIGLSADAVAAELNGKDAN